jgi:transcriptional antiterminator RfaH
MRLQMSSELASTTLPADGWIVIWAEARAEKQVARRVQAIGLECWLPSVKQRRRWSDRWKEIETPLFPGYLFARTPMSAWSRVLRIPGVLSVVKQGRLPAVLSDRFIEALRDAISRDGSSPEPVTDCGPFHPGDEVIVQDGALRGVRGVVRERRSGRQLVIWVAEISRGVAFTIGSALVKPAQQR